MTASPDRADVPRLHLVTDDRVLRAADFVEVARRVVAAGGSSIALHLRGPGLTGRALWTLASTLAPETAAVGAWLIVNDRLDVAIAGGATGVQLGRRGVPVADARGLLPREMRIGASVHDPEGARAAAEEGADFVLAGTLFETPSHPGRVPTGAGWLREIASLPVPVVGIGGISVDRVAEVRGAGAHGVAVIRGVWSAADPAAATAKYLETME